MAEKLSTIKNNKNTAPRAHNATSPQIGEVFKIAASASAQSVNLSALFQQPASTAMFNNQKHGVTDNIITIHPDGADLYIITGPTLASISGANAPGAGTVGTLNSGTGVYTAAAGTAYHMVNNIKEKFQLEFPADSWMGFISVSATGTVSLYQSSPGNP
jgi:hypothetical protein